jgi:hypothetical protein
MHTTRRELRSARLLHAAADRAAADRVVKNGRLKQSVSRWCYNATDARLLSAVAT